jgi:hypothetical protein
MSEDQDPHLRWPDERLLDPSKPDPIFDDDFEYSGKSSVGFVADAELLNGRMAMMGFAISMLQELVFGKGVIELCGLPYDSGAVLLQTSSSVNHGTSRNYSLKEAASTLKHSLVELEEAMVEVNGTANRSSQKEGEVSEKVTSMKEAASTLLHSLVELQQTVGRTNGTLARTSRPQGEATGGADRITSVEGLKELEKWDSNYSSYEESVTARGFNSSSAIPRGQMYYEDTLANRSYTRTADIPVDSRTGADWAKTPLSDIELAEQSAKLDALAEKWRQRQENKDFDAAQLTGWSKKAEVINGRCAMFFILTGLVTEYYTGQSMPQQIATLLQNLGIIEAD